MVAAKKILIVEDNTSDAWLIRTAVDQEGILAEFQMVVNGEQALQFIQQATPKGAGQHQDTAAPDLLILDLNLPRCSGQEILKEWKASPLAGVPVLVITSSDSPRDRETARSHTPYYFRKPIDFDEFMAIGGMVRQILAHRAGMSA